MDFHRRQRSQLAGELFRFQGQRFFAVLPRINSVAKLATAMAVSQPTIERWRGRLLSAVLILELHHIRSISPQSELPTVRWRPRWRVAHVFGDWPMASEIFFCKSSFILM